MLEYGIGGRIEGGNTMEEKREKSNMELWAEEEIRIACERERGGTSED